MARLVVAQGWAGAVPRQPPPRHASSVPQMDFRQPQNKQHSPNAPPEAAEAAALGEQVSSAGAQSHVPPLQSPCCPPGPSSAPALSWPESVLEVPEPGEGSWSSEEEEREICHPLQPCPGRNYMEQELSQGEVSTTSRSSQGENNSNRTSPQENWRRITIRTVWVNPDYPELLRNSLQEEGATPSASDEQVPAAGTQSRGPASPRSSPRSSRSQLAAQTLGELRGMHRQPSRRALQALCTLLWCSCMELQLDD